MEQEIEQKLAKLAEARAERDEAKLAAKNELEFFVNNDEDYVRAAKRAQRQSEIVEELEAEVKDWAIAHFDGTNKAVHPKVTIKSFDVTKVTYDPTRAHAWCLTNFTPALKLDTKTFEKAALSGTIPAEVVTVTPEKENRAQIATDLSEYLEG